MSREYADVLLTKISSPLVGKQDLNDAVKLKIEEEVSRTAVKTMNRRRTARGYRSGTKMYSGELVVEVGIPEEVDWDEMFKLDDEFRMEYDLGDGGRRYQLVDCIITNISLEGDEDGGVQKTISFMALDHRGTPGGLFGF